MLRITIKKDKNIQNQIVQEAINLINSGDMKLGYLLPSINSLSSTLHVSRTSVIGAYEKLVHLGLIEGKARSGYFVSSTPRTVASDSQAPSSTAPNGSAIDTKKNDAVSLLPDGKIPAVFVRNFFAESRFRKMHTDENKFLQAITSLLGTVRRITLYAGHTVVSNNISELLLGVAVAIKCRKARPTVILEEPGCPRAREIFHSLGFTIIALPVDKHGLQVEHLARVAADCVYLTPSHQYPTAATLSHERREFLANWLVREQAWLIEDDSFSLLYLKPPRALPFAISHPGERIIYLASLNTLLGSEHSIAIGHVPPPLYQKVKRFQTLLADGQVRIARHLVSHYLQSNRVIKDLVSSPFR